MNASKKITPFSISLTVLVAQKGETSTQMAGSHQGV
jgi:hypothetical protein